MALVFVSLSRVPGPERDIHVGQVAGHGGGGGPVHHSIADTEQSQTIVPGAYGCDVRLCTSEASVGVDVRVFVCMCLFVCMYKCMFACVCLYMCVCACV